MTKEFINPDSTKERKYRWDIRYQREILGMLLMDKVFLVQSLGTIRPSYFVDRAHEAICSIIFKYFEKYNTLPTKYFIINEIKERFDEKKA